MWTAIWHHVIYVGVLLAAGVGGGWFLKGRYGVKVVADVQKVEAVVKGL